MSGFNMDDYVPVNERLEAFYKKYPKGSIQSEIVELTEARVTIKAYAFREPDDPRPGTGLSSLGIPGSTTFTRGSEIENAETSAWGRAIAALGFEVRRGVASREEVRNKQPTARAAGAGGASRSLPADSPAPEMPEFPPNDVGEPTLEEVLEVTGGKDVTPPTDLQERIDRAKAKGQGAERICPTHGPDKVRKNSKGLFCATNMGTRDDPNWCDWTAAA